MIDSIISHGCFLRLQKCSVQRSILGDWSRLDYGVELQDMLMLGTYYYQAESRIASLLAEDVSRYASDDDNSSRNSFPCRTVVGSYHALFPEGTPMELQHIIKLKVLRKLSRAYLMISSSMAQEALGRGAETTGFNNLIALTEAVKDLKDGLSLTFNRTNKLSSRLSSRGLNQVHQRLM
ncbi:hypothetical protein Rs2_41593 [Raphanus sativus]|nr:hypothetical protein Rs2_41593 [Raphanus sativus]